MIFIIANNFNKNQKCFGWGNGLKWCMKKPYLTSFLNFEVMMRTRQKLFTNKPRNISDNCFLMYSKCLNQYITFWKWIIAFEVEYQLLEPKFSQCKSRWYCRNQCKGLFSHLVLRSMHDVTILKVSLIKHFFVYQKCWYFLLLRIFFQDSNKNLYILRRICTDFINTLQS